MSIAVKILILYGAISVSMMFLNIINIIYYYIMYSRQYGCKKKQRNIPSLIISVIKVIIYTFLPILNIAIFATINFIYKEKNFYEIFERSGGTEI